MRASSRDGASVGPSRPDCVGFGDGRSNSGTGRFAEAVLESSERLAKSGGGSATIVCFATTSGNPDLSIQLGKDLREQLARAQPTVHVVLLANSQQGAAGSDIAVYVAKATGGRFETIVTPITLTTLLPEMGAFVAKSTAAKGGMFRLTVERPAGAKGDLGKITFGSGAFTATKIAVEP